jgi:hypothetical protein
MEISQQPIAPSEMTPGQAFWGYIRESAVTEFRSMLRMLVAPVRALWAGSLEPIRTAYRRLDEDGDRVLARYKPLWRR